MGFNSAFKWLKDTTAIQLLTRLLEIFVVVTSFPRVFRVLPKIMGQSTEDS